MQFEALRQLRELSWLGLGMIRLRVRGCGKGGYEDEADDEKSVEEKPERGASSDFDLHIDGYAFS
jgi:hypothetical protein